MLEAERVHIRHDVREGGAVAFITIDNEARLNALDSELMESFVYVVEPLGHDPHLRCVVLTGAGKRAFVGGADVDEMARIAFPAEARAFIDKVHGCCEMVRNLPVPVIARINGHALGAGLELAASCDLRVASDNATFGMPEVRLGMPSVVEAALLPGLVGWTKAREMMLLGETFGAADALAMGLISAAVPARNLDTAVEKLIAGIFASPPNALRLQKALMRRWENLPMRDAITAGAEAFGQAYLTDEPSVAISAWREARVKKKTKA
jgi:enoyl-CoA hydratase/carnithine racemase